MKKYIILSLCASAAVISCTGKFEEYNLDPNAVTSEQLQYDGLSTGTYFLQMQAGVSTVGVDKGGRFQQNEGLEGDIFSGQIACINNWQAANHECYSLAPAWYDVPFQDAYIEVMQPWYKIKQVCDETGNANVLAMATIVKVLGMSRITDMYGPIPYTQFGAATHVPYDSQKDIYYAMFDELTSASETLATVYEANPNATILSKYDNVYDGSVGKWIKFANSLRLRLAMRISYVDETKAKSEAQAALAAVLGVMSSSSDNAMLHNGGKLTFINPLWEISESFNDQRMSANMESYLSGYADPRLAKYFRTNSQGEFKGMRNGVNNINNDRCKDAISGLNFESADDMWWMDASECYFLQAEMALRWGIGDAKSLYEEGIRTSFSSKGVTGADSYIADNTSVPANYVAPTSSNTGSSNISAVSTATIAWDDALDQDEKLEKIMIQKWIALYPNGQEAWSEIRRTGYPKIFNIQTNLSNEVANGEVISRLKYPSSEYSNNNANVAAGVNLIGGNDSAGARLWWDTKR